MEIKPAEIAEVIKQQIEKYDLKPQTYEVGYVFQSGDGIARVYGLDNCMYGEMLEFEAGVYGMAMNLEEDNVGCVLLGNPISVTEGSMVKRTGKPVEVPVGDALIGRVIDPMGNALDGKGKVNTVKYRPIEYPAPGVIERQPVKEPLQTGIMAVDSIVPIGRGQRELIIGDRQTGKTALAIDAILNQKNSDVICIYVAIGQKNSTVAGIVNTLTEFGAMDYTIVVSSTASDESTIQYIAPYAGCAMAEEFMYEQQKDVLIVYDDLSKHAIAYRAMSLLLKRPPGREAYPGDVFYLHSRLLERAGRLHDNEGGGSITALPIIETQDGDVSAYIPTNVISITDGQIYLETELFNAGQRPAVNVGLSVSRVGGAAQIGAMKKIAAPIRINLAQFRELEIFSQFGSELDQITRDKLSQGESIIETLKQPQYSPMPVEDQIILLYAATNKYLMNVPIREIKAFNKNMLDFIRENHPQTQAMIREKNELTEEIEDAIRDTLEEYIKSTKMDGDV